MPLLLISGFPCSGKSARTEQIAAYFRQRISENGLGLTVHVVGDDAQGIARSVYHAGPEEKNARAAVLAATERLLSKDAVVIVDAMNSIKGYRYQMYCLARGAATTSGVVFCGISADMARAWNSARQPDSAYPPDMYSLSAPRTNGTLTVDRFEDLVMRFEEPDSFRRWDQPLFTVIPDDVDLPLADIWSALVERKADRPHTSTIRKATVDAKTTNAADQITQEILDAIQRTIKDLPSGSSSSVTVMHGGDTLVVRLPARHVAVSELRRIRRQYLSMAAHSSMGNMSVIKASGVAKLFVDYLNSNFD